MAIRPEQDKEQADRSGNAADAREVERNTTQAVTTQAALYGAGHAEAGKALEECGRGGGEGIETCATPTCGV